MNRIKTIIFDMDNTLLDFMKMKREGIKAAIEAMINNGLKMNKDEGYKKLFYTYIQVGIESDIAFTEFLKKETGKVDPRILAAAINAYLETKSRTLKLFSDVVPTLKNLREKGIKLIILTDAPKVKAYQRLLSMKIDKLFDHVFGFEDTEKKKKTDIPLKAAIDKLNLNPKETMMIGDSIKRDVIPAKKCGVVATWAKYGASEKVDKIKPDYELNQFSEILKIIN
jgi:FMN phosphatase YigB (HAD superfamily)